MWNQKLKSLLQGFLHSKDPTKIEQFFEEQTQSFLDPDATHALSEQEVYDSTRSIDHSLSMEQLHSMNFDLPMKDTPRVNLGTSRYSALSKLGQGGMATVWQMKDSQLLRSVALKQLLKEKAESNYEQENFVVEAQITAQLQHPGIVPIHDLQVDESENVYFTMREIKGQTLDDIIASVHRVSDRRWNTTHSGWNLRRLIDGLDKICQTIAYAHARGVIHQDLKPANIMVGDYGEVLVVDWGVAKVRSLYEYNPNWVQVKASTAYLEHKRISISGTPRYMAPEQIHGPAEGIDGRADIYALGVILFYILTQDKPFSGKMAEILHHKKTQSASIHDWLLEHPNALPIPTELVDICQRAMEFNPADRFNDAKEMHLEIQSWLDGARQEEEARRILLEVDAIQKKIDHLEILSDKLVPTLNHPSIHETRLPEEWWLTWLQVEDYRTNIEQLRDAIYQKAQGAILYAPHLPEIYNRLIELEYQDYLDAVLEGKHKSISKTERRLNAYLQHLSVREQERWANIRAVDLASLQSQKSHGVNIERRTEKQQVLNDLTEYAWISIVGLAGIGKTHLAWQVATQWCKQYGWDVIFCDVTDCITPASLLQRLTQALGVQQTGSDPFELTISILNRTHPKYHHASESSILIIDNAESLNTKSTKLLNTILEQCSNIRLLTTTRQSFAHPNEHVFSLHPMSVLDGVELFTQHCKQHLPSWSLTENNRHNVFNIVNTLDRIPLAIELAGSRIAEFSLSEIVSRLSERFALLRSNDVEQPTLQMALSWSCTSLSDLEKQVLYELSVIPASFTLPFGEALIELPHTHSLSDILDVLTQHSLLNREYRNGKTVYTMLKSIRDYAQTKAGPDLLHSTHLKMGAHLANSIEDDHSIQFDDALLRIGSLYGNPTDGQICCQQLLQKLKEFGPIVTGLEIAEQFLERPDILEEHKRSILLLQIDFLHENGQSEKALQQLVTISKTQPSLRVDPEHILLDSMVSPFRKLTSIESTDATSTLLQDQYAEHIKRHEWTQAMTCAARLYAAESLRDKQSSILRRCVEDLSNGGQIQQALGIAEHLDELYLEQGVDRLTLMIDIAVLHTRLGNRERAIERYHLALDLSEKRNIKESQARIIGNLGLLYQSDGNLELAIRQYKRAYSIFALLGNMDKLSALDGNLGTIYHEQGNLTEAIQHFDQAIEASIQSKNEINQGVFLGNRAMCAIDLQKMHQARHDLEQAIEICDRNLEFAAGAFRGELALLCVKQGEPDLAISLLRKGEEQVRQHKEQYGKFLCRKSSVFYAIHNQLQAKQALRQAEQLCIDLQLRSNSSLQRRLNETQREIPASVWLSEQEIVERHFVANIAFRWARYEITATQYPQALHHLHKALQLFEVLRETEQILEIRYNIAIVYSHTGRLKDAIAIVKDIRQQHVILGNTVKYGVVTNFLGGCHRRLGEVTQALQYHEESLQILGECNSIRQVAALEKAGLCCRIIGDYARSLAYLEQALEMALSNNMRAGTLYCNVGLCHNVMGDEDKALEFYHLGIKELRKVGDRNRESLYLGNIANIYARKKEYTEADALYKEVIHIAMDTGVKSNECIARGNYGDLLLNMGESERAAEELLSAIEIGMEIYPIAANVFTGTLARLRSLEENHTEAFRLLDTIDRDLLQTDVEEYTKFLCVSAEIQLNASQRTSAYDLFTTATELMETQQFSKTTDVYMKWIAIKDLLETSPAQ